MVRNYVSTGNAFAIARSHTICLHETAKVFALWFGDNRLVLRSLRIALIPRL